MDHIKAVFEKPIAHRGLHDAPSGVIENSIDAFESAIAHGFAMECDVQLTGDDNPVVFHDQNLDRLTAQHGKLSDISADQLCRIPLKGSTHAPQTFAQFLEHIDGRTPLIVELKPQGTRNTILAERVIEIARSYNGPLVFKSFDPRILCALHKKKCPFPIGIVVEAERPDGLTWSQAFALRNLLHLPYSHFQFISCNVSDLEMWPVKLLRKFGMRVMTWTVDKLDELHPAAQHADQIVFEGAVGQHLIERQA